MMKRMLGYLLAAVLSGTMAVAVAASATAVPAKAVCLVCKVKEGATEAEPVVATREYEGKSYGFCSEPCAQAFMADPAAFVPPVLPREAPRFSLVDLEGRTVSNESLKGEVVLVDFWATWCAPYRKSMPELQALHAKYGARGFRVVGISIDEGGPAKVKRFVAARKLRYPIAVDSAKEPAWDAFRVKAIPAAFLLDRDGRIVAQWTGLPADGREVERRLEELLHAD